ncbi:hypothetical protein QAD02_013939 [Eretmocerus hayati]|uniref:Uncharacterized protein n=1 Tax=Eretmocerus hayati TaxID=131215 RepID=A0ACC2P457_9HYME|nr:hypothetical protein QAD02_013939 [Eretmocerus hayati]
MVEADESNLIKACAMAENEARAGSEKSVDTVILAALNNSVNEQETSAGKIQVSEKSDGITLLDSITDPTGVEVRHVIDTEENSIVDLTQSVGSNCNIVSSDNAHVLEQRDTSPSPLANPSVSDEDIVADVTKNNTDHASTASNLPSENLEDSQACVPISSRKRSIVSEDEMLEAQSVSVKRARIEEAIDSAKNDDTTTVIFPMKIMEQRPVFPMSDIYNTTAVFDQAQPQSWGKRSSSKFTHHISLCQQPHVTNYEQKKKDQQHSSPVKKRIKESSPQNPQRRYHTSSPPPASLGLTTCPKPQSRPQSPSTHPYHPSASRMQHNHFGDQKHSSMKQQTITIHDTPSPSVSIITISDSEDDASTKRSVYSVMFLCKSPTSSPPRSPDILTEELS